MSTEAMDAREIRKKAILICHIASEVDVSFTLRDRALPALQALQDNRVVVALMKVGMFSLGIRSMAGREDFAEAALNDLVGIAHVPKGLLGLGMRYGLMAAPRDERGYAPVEMLLDHVDRFQQSYGAIDIDREVANAITAEASRICEIRRSAPEGQGA
jgi:hypothetical protein